LEPLRARPGLDVTPLGRRCGINFRLVFEVLNGLDYLLFIVLDPVPVDCERDLRFTVGAFRCYAEPSQVDA
jgi:hypothetical protein